MHTTDQQISHNDSPITLHVMMILSIRNKLILIFAFLAIVMTTIIFMAMLTSFRYGFLRYINSERTELLEAIQEQIEEEYVDAMDWQKNIQDERFFRQLGRQMIRRALHDISDEQKENAAPARPLRPERLHWLSRDKKVIHGRESNPKNLITRKIVIDRELQGYIGLERLKRVNQRRDQLFVASQTDSFLWISLLASALGIFCAYFLARWMVGPINEINQAMQALRAHDYQKRLTKKSKDEIGELVQSFNHLAQTLEQHEKSQQQWIADISHELRTPLATLRGEIEALQDGVRKLSLQQMDSLHEEVLHIQRIVDDLHQLALSDLGALRYQFSPTDITAIIERVVNQFEISLTEKLITVDFQSDENIPEISGDDSRLLQAFTNLMQNSSRYTHQGGKIVISTSVEKNNVKVIWQDSAPGVSDAALPQLFNRLYREETSRNRQQGGSGLGLSIVAAIVKSHQGRIKAEHSPTGGLTLTLLFPIH